jgi:acyl carrier protein
LRPFATKRPLGEAAPPPQGLGPGFIFASKTRNQDASARAGWRRGRAARAPACVNAPRAAHKTCKSAARRPLLFRGTARPNGAIFVTDQPQDIAKLKEEIIEVIASEGMVDRSKVTPDATIESLDLKSVDIVMILTALEEKFNVYIPMDGSLQEAKTVEALIGAIAEHIQKERENQ